MLWRVGIVAWEVWAGKVVQFKRLIIYYLIMIVPRWPSDKFVSLQVLSSRALLIKLNKQLAACELASRRP